MKYYLLLLVLLQTMIISLLQATLQGHFTWVMIHSYALNDWLARDVASYKPPLLSDSVCMWLRPSVHRSDSLSAARLVPYSRPRYAAKLAASRATSPTGLHRYVSGLRLKKNFRRWRRSEDDGIDDVQRHWKRSRQPLWVDTVYSYQTSGHLPLEDPKPGISFRQTFVRLTQSTPLKVL